MSPIKLLLDDLERREDHCWNMARVFLVNKDARGLSDIGVEIQALARARAELKRLTE